LRRLIPTASSPTESLVTSRLSDLSAGLGFLSFYTLQRYDLSSPLRESGLSGHSQFRSRVFSTPQRLQLTQAPQPYFVPQPFLGASFRVFPSRRSRVPSGTASFPAVIHQRSRRTTWSSSASVSTDSHAETQLPESPATYGAPFSKVSLASRHTEKPKQLSRLFRQLHLLRSVTPCTNPFTQTMETTASGRYSLDLLPL
jgi:hypothetical protein